MSTAGTCQPSVASAQCLPLAAPMQPLVAADGGDWHPVVSCPATWVPHWGWGWGAGSRYPPCSFHSNVFSSLPAPVPSAHPVPSASSPLHRQHCKQNPALPGGCRAGKKAWDQLLLPPPILPPRSSYLPPPTPIPPRSLSLPIFWHQLIWRRYLNPSPFP